MALDPFFHTNVLHFHSWQQFKYWLNTATDDLGNHLFFIDYEFSGENVTGLDLINDHNLDKYAVLVTSRYEEKMIVDVCAEKGIRMLPKFIAPFVSIR